MRILVSSVYYVNLQHHTSIHTSIFTTTLTQWTITFLMCSIVTTIYSTGNPFNNENCITTNNHIHPCPGVIVFRLWKSQVELRKCGILTNGSLIHRIMKILVESAALYSVNHLLYVILYEMKDQVEITTGYLVSLSKWNIFPNLKVAVGSKHGNYDLQLNNYSV